VRTIDEAVALLMGVPAGERDPLDEFPESSINGRVAAQLQAYSAIRQTWAAAPPARKWTAGAKKKRP
jgi:hypothetical protein